MTGRAPLSVTASLALLSAQGETVTVTADGPVIVVNLPRLFPRRWPPGPLAGRRRRASLLASLQRGLQVADLTLQVRVRRQVVAQLAPQSRPTPLSRLLGVGAMEIHLLPALRAVLHGSSAGGAGRDR